MYIADLVGTGICRQQTLWVLVDVAILNGSRAPEDECAGDEVHGAVNDGRDDRQRARHDGRHGLGN